MAHLCHRVCPWVFPFDSISLFKVREDDGSLVYIICPYFFKRVHLSSWWCCCCTSPKSSITAPHKQWIHVLFFNHAFTQICRTSGDIFYYQNWSAAPAYLTVIRVSVCIWWCMCVFTGQQEKRRRRWWWLWMESGMTYMSRKGGATLCTGSKRPLKSAAVPGSIKETKTPGSCLTRRTSAKVWR